MAITAASVTYLGTGPTATLQILADSEMRGPEAQKLYGYATFVGDAQASTSATLNYIDGTAALAFTPTAFLFSRCGGTSTATIVPTNLVDAANSAKTATVTFSAALGAGNTLTFAVVILK